VVRRSCFAVERVNQSKERFLSVTRLKCEINCRHKPRSIDKLNFNIIILLSGKTSDGMRSVAYGCVSTIRLLLLCSSSTDVFGIAVVLQSIAGGRGDSLARNTRTVATWTCVTNANSVRSSGRHETKGLKDTYPFPCTFRDVERIVAQRECADTTDIDTRTVSGPRHFDRTRPDRDDLRFLCKD
jgi:hypothetical protein